MAISRSNISKQVTLGGGKRSQSKIGTVMREYKAGKLHQGSKKGPVVKSRKQAVAIAMSEARRASTR